MAAAKIQVKRANAAAWTSANTVLFAGEIGLELDTFKFKIGNGSTAWNSLAYSISSNLSASTLNDLGDVTITSAADGDFLRWNGTAWINDAVNLSTDTIGSYVQSLVAGTGITLTNNSGEGATPTVAVTTNTFDAFGAASTAAGNAATALSNHEADTTNIHGIADTSILVTTTGSQTLTNKTITSPSGLVKGDVGLANADNISDANKPVSTATQTALDLKANLASPTFTGTVVLPDNTVALGTKTTGDYVSSLVAGTGVTLTNNSGENTTPTIAIGQSVATSASPTFVNVTAALTGNASTATTLQTSRNIAGQAFDGSANISIAPTDLTGVTSSAAELNILDGVTATAAELNILDGVTATAAELNILDGATLSTAELNILDGATLTTTELNYVDGVTSAIQTQIDLKAPLASPTFTGTVTVPTPIGDTTAATKLYVDTTASTTAGNASTALTNHEADTTNIHGIADTSILVTTTGSQTLTNKTITSPSGLVKGDVGLGNVDNTSNATERAASATLTNKTLTSPVINTPTGIVKGDVGLGNVDNTSDVNKPVSTAGQTALDLKAPLASPTFTGSVTVPTPTSDAHAATKAYADAIAAGINWHNSVETATAAALPNTPTYSNGTSGVGATLTASANARLVMDGANATTGDRVLVKNQADATQNGIYVVTAQGSVSVPYLLTRASDHDNLIDEVIRGDAVYVANGATNINQGFIISSEGTGANDKHVLGTDDMNWSQFTGAANITAGTGITKTGNTLSIGQSVATDASVTFTAVTAALTGNASTATTLATARNIAGQSFNGSANISIAPTDLTGVTATAAELNILDGATLSTAELNILDGATLSTAELNILDGVTATTAELNYVDGVTSAIQTQIDTKAPIASPTFTGTVTIPTGASITAPTGLVKGDVGLGSVDNTADTAKPVSTATQTALDLKANLASPTFTGTVTLPDNTVALGAKTTGDYVSSLVAGTGVTLTNNSGETATPTVAIGQAVGTGDSVTFVGVTAALTGNASTATTLQTARNIAGQSFNGSANISIAPTDLTGVTSTAAEINILDGATLTVTELNYVDGVTSAIQTQIDTKAPLASPTFTGTVTIPTGASITAPTGLVKGDVGLGSVDNTADTAKPVSTAQQTALDLKANIASPTFTGTVTIPTGASITAPTGLVKGDVGLGNVDNTSDVNKPVSTATQTALDLKAPLASPTFTGTVTLPVNTVALGTTTTGDYVATITGGTGVTSTAATSGEGTTHSLSIGQAVGTSDNVTFAGVTADNIKVGVTGANEIDTVSGDLTIDSAGGTVTVDDNLTVTGNLTVSGTTTSINTETLTVDDNIIVLNNNATGSPTANAGIEVERGSSTNVVLRWNETDDIWELTNNGSAYEAIATQAYVAAQSITSLDDIGNVTAPTPTTGDFLKYNGTAWVNDAIDLSTDTTGSYVASLTAGTGVTLTNNSGEGATPTVAIGQAVGTGDSVTFVGVTAALTGNASTATTLATARNIAGQSFNGSANISIAPTDLTGVTSTAAELNILDGATLTVTELNYVDGVTSAIQTQIDAKQATLVSATSIKTINGSSLLGSGDLTVGAAAPTTTSITANTATTVDSFVLATYRSAEFTIQVTQGSKYTTVKALVLHDGTTPQLVQYGIIEIGSPAIALTLSSVVSGANVVLQATITDAATTNAEVKVLKTTL